MTSSSDPSLFSRLGAAMARHRRRVLAAWAAALVVAAALSGVLVGSLGSASYSVDGSQSARAAEVVTSGQVPGVAPEQDVVVFSSERLRYSDPAFRAEVERVASALRGQPLVRGVVTPEAVTGLVSGDGRVALALVELGGDDGERLAAVAELREAIGAAGREPAVEALLTGNSPLLDDITEEGIADLERAEAIGLPLAFAVLALALGALVAAAVPVIVALVGTLTALGLLGAASLLVGFDAFLLNIVTMIGIGVGIDYALFMTSRFREELRRRGTVEAAAAATAAATGRTIFYSGVVVAIALCSLFVVSASIFREIAVGAAAVIACTVAAGLTYRPARRAALGPRLERGALPARLRPAELRGGRASGWSRWAHALMRRPWRALIAALVVLVAASLPLTDLRLGIVLGARSVAEQPSGRAVLRLAEHFPRGTIAPVRVVLTSPDGLDREERRAAAGLARALEARAGVARAAVAPVPEGARATVVSAVLDAPVDSTRASAAVRAIRDEVAPRFSSADLRILVGGLTATFVDIGDEASGKLPLVLAIVLVISFAFLTLVFRSLLLPLKAVAMNLLSVGAAYGLLVLVFQHGFAQDLLGFQSTGVIMAYLPLLMFALLFGLSMDYEVFLVRRMQEHHLAGAGNAAAVADGIAQTARPITAAAAVMVLVFGSFVTASVLEIKQMGFALATAILIDATLVRLVLVPALMCLAGRWNWWLPAWLGARLPAARAG